MLIFPSNDFDKNKITNLFYRAIEIKIKGVVSILLILEMKN